MDTINISTFYNRVVNHGTDWVKKKVEELKIKGIKKMTHYKVGYFKLDSIVFEFTDGSKPILYWINDSWPERIIFAPAATGLHINTYTNGNPAIAQIVFDPITPDVNIEYKIIIPSLDPDSYLQLIKVFEEKGIENYFVEEIVK